MKKGISTFRKVWLAKHYVILSEKYATGFFDHNSYESPEVECYADFASPMTYAEFKCALNEGMKILEQINFLRNCAVRRIDFNQVQRLYNNYIEIQKSYTIDGQRKWPIYYETQCQKFGLPD